MITSQNFVDAIISGANNIYKNRVHINELNIFPVPDGDTGTNMSMTIMSAAEKLSDVHDLSISEIAVILSSTALRSARGNSGVILSLILKGFKDAFKELKEASARDLIKALSNGVKNAYGAISNPVEGTILTVIRMAFEEGSGAIEKLDKHGISISGQIPFVWSAVCRGARKALNMTPQLLPALKKAGVIDAGGKGLCLILEGMLSVYKDGIIIDKENLINPDIDDKFSSAIAAFDEDLTYIYCTEFIIKKRIENSFNICKFRNSLEKIGNCVVVADDDEIIKTHVHTNFPNKSLEIALGVGHLLTIKIENMDEQRKRIQESMPVEEIEKSFEFEKVEPHQNAGIVAVVSGAGLIEVFEDLGVDKIVIGGQTLNPSAGEIAAAAMAVPAKTVFILPNNQNIILTAQQAKEMVTDREIVVIPTKTIPSGLNAMMVFNRFLEPEQISQTLINASQAVRTGLVTYADRDAEFSKKKIKQNDIIALNSGVLSIVGSNIFLVCEKLIKEMINNKTEFVTIIYGIDVDRKELILFKEKLENKFQKIEFQLIDGGSEIYYFTISIE